MPSAIAMPIRQEIVRLRQQGQRYGAIGTALNLSPHSVRQIWRRFQQHGEAGLAPNYERCGHHGVKSEQLIWRAAVYLKRRHPAWGGGIIRVHLQQRWQAFHIPSERTLQRWFRAAGVGTPLMPKRPSPQVRATQVHECWQVDAVSHQTLADGTQVSWLSATDEVSGALLEGSVFPLCQF